MPKLPSKVETDEKTEFVAGLKQEGKKQSTIIEYIRKYDAIYNNIHKDLKSLDYDDIVKYIRTVKNLNTRASQLNIFIMLNYENKELKEKLKKNREELQSSILEHTQESNNNIDVVPVSKLYNYLDELYKESKFKEYIINYLLLNFYVRNEDIDVMLYQENQEPDEYKNYLKKINKDTIMYVRNKYKTYDIHGVKKHKITDRKFINAFDLLTDKQDRLLTKKSIGTEVKNATFDKLGETKYLKYIIDDIRNTGNIDKLVEISKSRGTDINLLLSNYNLKLKIV